MNLVLERLDVTKNYVTVDSPIQFYIQINDDTEHRVLKSPQAIQIDCRKLLSHFYMPNEPAWKLSIVYDKDLLSEHETVKWSAHNVDFAGSTNSVDGELVKIDLTDLYTHLQDNNTVTNENLDIVITKLNKVGNNREIQKFGKSQTFSKFLFFDSRFLATIFNGLDNDYSVIGVINSEGGLVRIDSGKLTIFGNHNYASFSERTNTISGATNSLAPKTYTTSYPNNYINFWTEGNYKEISTL